MAWIERGLSESIGTESGCVDKNRVMVMSKGRIYWL
jgi:hypothetical protein